MCALSYLDTFSHLFGPYTRNVNIFDHLVPYTSALSSIYFTTHAVIVIYNWSFTFFFYYLGFLTTNTGKFGSYGRLRTRIKKNWLCGMLRMHDPINIVG